MRLAGKFETVITAQSTVAAELSRERGFESTTNVVSDVGGNIVEGLRFLSITMAESAVVNANLRRLVNWDTTIAVVSAVDPNNMLRDIKWNTSLAVVSTVSGTVVVITNTLELTLSEGEFFFEISDRVLQLTSTSEDSVHVINDVLGDRVVIVTEDIGSVETSSTTDN